MTANIETEEFRLSRPCRRAGSTRRAPLPPGSTYTLSPRMQYIPGFWMTCTPDCKARSQARRSTAGSRGQVPGCMSGRRRTHAVWYAAAYTEAAEVPHACPRMHKYTPPPASWAECTPAVTRPPRRPASCLPAPGPHLCGIHPFLALLQQQVPGLVVPAQHSLRVHTMRQPR